MHHGWYVEDTTHGPIRVDRFDQSRRHRSNTGFTLIELLVVISSAACAPSSKLDLPR